MEAVVSVDLATMPTAEVVDLAAGLLAAGMRAEECPLADPVGAAALFVAALERVFVSVDPRTTNEAPEYDAMAQTLLEEMRAFHAERGSEWIELWGPQVTTQVWDDLVDAGARRALYWRLRVMPEIQTTSFDVLVGVTGADRDLRKLPRYPHVRPEVGRVVNWDHGRLMRWLGVKPVRDELTPDDPGIIINP